MRGFTDVVSCFRSRIPNFFHHFRSNMDTFGNFFLSNAMSEQHADSVLLLAALLRLLYPSLLIIYPFYMLFLPYLLGNLVFEFIEGDQ